MPESATASNPYQLPKDYPAPRDVLRQHFPRTAKQCLFRGGWGYSIDDAVEVLEFDPEINPDQRFDGVSLEYAFVDKRIREELIHAPNARRFDHLSWQVIEQSLHERDGILRAFALDRGFIPVPPQSADVCLFCGSFAPQLSVLSAIILQIFLFLYCNLGQPLLF